MLRPRRSLLFVIAVAVCCSQLAAEQPESTTLDLWPGLPPGSTLRGEGDVPKLILTRVESKEPTAAVVILPGGGYNGHAMDHEGYQFAQWFHSLGIPSAICTYRLRGKGNDGKGYGHPAPMIDAQRAIQTLRANASEWNLDPNRIGVIGFSAGGHLCSTVSTHFAKADPVSEDPVARVSSRPDFSILCYPVIAFDKPYSHGGSQRNLIGADPDPELVIDLSNERQVSEHTPPTFLFHTAADRVVPVQNSLDYFLACQEHGVPAELHVFPEGRHGVGLAKNLSGADQWPELCANWLRRIGVVAAE
ncbi:alpha/beta hydrolase [Roseiconus nitratireducens]|uniref:Alpha/beta hydrolase n=1 Tax=Roseiconus nitratireducens TaxID=2605748 RepID=A0A5M6CY36_9BACT|nr:alpha/beta hydrolase [Roseiconus nitratireducens]KAA5538912.1 alpha/beta hydrolase [Roseiconus nitratireducens]